MSSKRTTITEATVAIGKFADVWSFTRMRAHMNGQSGALFKNLEFSLPKSSKQVVFALFILLFLFFVFDHYLNETLATVFFSTFKRSIEIDL